MKTKRGKKIIIIGGGLGGLSAAASLAAEGFSVRLFEKNEKLGGKLNEMQQQGFRFDLGPSIIILPYIFRRLWEKAGKNMEEYLEFQELTPQWRSFFEDGMVIDLHSDMKQMEKELERFGDNASGYLSYLDYSRTIWKFTEEAYLENGADNLKAVLEGQKLFNVLKKGDLFSSMDQGVRNFIKEPHLKDMLNFFVKYVGSSAYDAPAIMNLLPYSQLGYGLWYVKGGMYNLARGLQKLLNELGVELNLNSEVTEIVKDGETVIGIKLKNGVFQNADIIVSNMEVIPAYKNLTGDGDKLTVKAYEHVFEPACSGLVVHLGLDKVYEQAAHHNFVFSKNSKLHWDTVHHEKKMPDDPTIYLVSPTVTNPNLAPKGHSILKLLPHIPYVQDPPITDKEYAALKERCYDKLERVGFENIRKHIVFEHVLTPEDIQRMYYSNKGAIYGIVCNRKKNYSLKAPKQSKLYKNLFFVGGSVNPGGGTPMVVLSGQKACELIVEKYG